MTITPTKLKAGHYYCQDKESRLGAFATTRVEAIEKCMNMMAMRVLALKQLKADYLKIEQKIEDVRTCTNTYNETQTELNYQLNTVFHEMMLVGSFTHADTVSFINQ